MESLREKSRKNQEGGGEGYEEESRTTEETSRRAEEQPRRMGWELGGRIEKDSGAIDKDAGGAVRTWNKCDECFISHGRRQVQVTLNCSAHFSKLLVTKMECNSIPH
ncbi:hypothetical protein chiPu_0014970 [Chiloscyllium punctatum]|uniref:Uncharacterized protein n=1 Tax=Chiloscyllium punctatum TaxID=137246 RepID=A0A401T1E6_CHIPU|nr:hypothetical protein [Chiloscyllium punctatum]